MSSGDVRLSRDGLEAQLAGGELLSLTSLRHAGAELLVGPEALPAGFRVHGRRAGITFMHPWANRLAADRFTVGDAEVVVPAGEPAVTRDAGGLAIHGLAQPGTWSVAADGRAAAVARGRFDAVPAFPFAHAVEVRFDLLPGARLEVRTTLRPTGDAPVPVAFGWHPYLRLPGASRMRWRLALPWRRHLGLDDHGIPDGTAEELGAEDDPLAERTFDDGFDGLDDGAVLAVAGGGRAIRVLLVSGYPAAQVFAPAAPDVVSPEPMTAPTDALRSGRGLRWAAPGSTFEAVFAVEVGAAR